MDTLFAFAFGLSVVALLIGILLLPFKARRAFGRRLALASVAAAVVAFVGFAVVSEPNAEALARREKAAQEVAAHAESETQKRLAEEARRQAADAARRGFFNPPEDQVAFMRAIDEGVAAFNSAANDLAKGGVRRERLRAICAAVRAGAVKGWSGTIAKLTANSDGLGVISIRLAKNLHVQTWNNALSDIGEGTLLDPDSAVFRKFAGLAQGAEVRFSGRFVRDQAGPDCFREGSLTMSGAMADPAFIFHFSDVETFSE